MFRHVWSAISEVKIRANGSWQSMRKLGACIKSYPLIPRFPVHAYMYVLGCYSASSDIGIEGEARDREWQ
jgi:hypothetical protein